MEDKTSEQIKTEINEALARVFNDVALNDSPDIAYIVPGGVNSARALCDSLNMNQELPESWRIAK